MHLIQKETHLSTDSIRYSRRRRCYLRFVFLLSVLICSLTVVPITAQTPYKQKRISARGFIDFGFLRFTAKKSFETILKKTGGPIFGGGAQIALRNGLFFEFDISQFKDTGQRVFIFDEEIFDLGIENAIKLTPIRITGGYRFKNFKALTPYLGAGVGFYRYEESSSFDDASEQFDQRHNGFHIKGGGEIAIYKWISLAGDIQWSKVPNGLGEGGVSQLFGETDLGGTSVSVRVILGS